MGLIKWIRKVWPAQTWGRHLLMCVILALVSWFGLAFFSCSAEKRADEWLKADRDVIAAVLNQKPDSSDPTIHRLQEQRGDACVRALRHLGIAVHFQARRYMGLIMATLFGVFAGACFVWISRKGWKDADPYIANLFALATLGTVFFGSFSSLFEHEKNIKVHMQSYAQSVGIANDVSTALAFRDVGTGKKPGTSQGALKNLATENDAKFEKLDLIPVGMSSEGPEKILDTYVKPIDDAKKQE